MLLAAPGGARLAPRRQTPILRSRLSRDHLSVISGVTLDGQLFLHLHDHAYDADGVVTFLQALLDQIVGNMAVIWNDAPIHCSQVAKDFLADGAAKRLHFGTVAGLCARS